MEYSESAEEKRKKVTAILMLEILGRPPEHLKETLLEIMSEMRKEEGVIITSEKINEPTELKDQKDIYVSFAEVEVEVESIMYIAMLMFKYMPAHIEIVSPPVVNLVPNEINEILNEVTRRLHGYDEVARVVQFEKGILEKKLRELLSEKDNKIEDKKEGKKENKSKKNKK
jgi:hypothetical protein